MLRRNSTRSGCTGISFRTALTACSGRISRKYLPPETLVLRYEKAAPDYTPETPPDSAPNNNKDHDHDNHKDYPLSSEERDFHVSSLVSANVTSSVSHDVRGRDLDVSEKVSENLIASGNNSRNLPDGFELRDDGNVYSSAGVKVAPSVIAMMLEKGADNDAA